MTCDDLYERLTDLAEGTLQGDLCAEVERHLAECVHCQDVRHDLEDLARLCRQSRPTPATMPEGVRQRIAALLSQDELGSQPLA